MFEISTVECIKSWRWELWVLFLVPPGEYCKTTFFPAINFRFMSLGTFSRRFIFAFMSLGTFSRRFIFVFMSLGTFSRLFIFVDSNTGKVIFASLSCSGP